MSQDTPSRALDKIIVRLPDGMRDRLKGAADTNNRSVNAEVVARLEDSFDEIVPEPVREYLSAQEDLISDYARTVRDQSELIRQQTERLDTMMSLIEDLIDGTKIAGKGEVKFSSFKGSDEKPDK